MSVVWCVCSLQAGGCFLNPRKDLLFEGLYVIKCRWRTVPMFKIFWIPQRTETFSKRTFKPMPILGSRPWSTHNPMMHSCYFFVFYSPLSTEGSLRGTPWSHLHCSIVFSQNAMKESCLWPLEDPRKDPWRWEAPSVCAQPKILCECKASTLLHHFAIVSVLLKTPTEWDVFLSDQVTSRHKSEPPSTTFIHII